MPFRFHCSLLELNYPKGRVYEVSALPPVVSDPASDIQAALLHTQCPPPPTNALEPSVVPGVGVGQLEAPRAVGGTVVLWYCCFQLCRMSYWG